MAFWGVEVKPGKPYTHSSKDSKGRLRISQATLATGSATVKSLVQCNVGDKSPVLLCALLPDKTESLQLDLEFDEADDVIFSVIGPRGVFLTGYYANHGRYSTLQDDTESYGEDIANSVESIRNSDEDEDEYEDSFINDDEPEVLTASDSSSRDDDEDYDDDEYLKKKKKKSNVKGGLKRLKKKCQIVESDDDEVDFIEIDDETPIASIRKVNKSAALEKKIKKETVNGETQRKVDEPNEVSESKSKSKKKKRGSSKEKSDTVNESNDINGDKINQNEVDDKTVLEAVANEEKAEIPVSEVKTKKKKKEKKGNVKADNENHIDDVLVAKDDDKSNDMVVTPEDKKKKRKTRGNSLEAITNQQPIIENGNNSDEKKTKKKKRRTSKTPEIDENTNMEVEKENKFECNKKTLSNGLVIEDLVTGNNTSKAKVAAPGKKVKVQYVVKLKENGQVVDSNGESPYKFRLGDKQVIEGLNVGIEGMKVGDKRRLTVPPSMSLGYKGTGENIPPNSWLVYDVEVCSVH